MQAQVGDGEGHDGHRAEGEDAEDGEQAPPFGPAAPREQAPGEEERQGYGREGQLIPAEQGLGQEGQAQAHQVAGPATVEVLEEEEEEQRLEAIDADMHVDDGGKMIRRQGEEDPGDQRRQPVLRQVLGEQEHGVAADGETDEEEYVVGEHRVAGDPVDGYGDDAEGHKVLGEGQGIPGGVVDIRLKQRGGIGAQGVGVPGHDPDIKGGIDMGPHHRIRHIGGDGEGEEEGEDHEEHDDQQMIPDEGHFYPLPPVSSPAPGRCTAVSPPATPKPFRARPGRSGSGWGDFPVPSGVQDLRRPAPPAPRGVHNKISSRPVLHLPAPRDYNRHAAGACQHPRERRPAFAPRPRPAGRAPQLAFTGGVLYVV